MCSHTVRHQRRVDKNKKRENEKEKQERIIRVGVVMKRKRKKEEEKEKWQKIREKRDVGKRKENIAKITINKEMKGKQDNNGNGVKMRKK